MNLINHNRLEPAADYAAGTASRDGTIIDVRGYSSVAFVVQFADIAASGDHAIKLQGGNAADGSDMSDLEGTGSSVAPSDANAIRVVDMTSPRFRYLRLVITKDGSNSCGESAIAHLYRGDRQPVEQSTWTETKLVHAPEAGAA